MTDWREEWFFMPKGQKVAYIIVLAILLCVLSIYFFSPRDTTNHLTPEEATTLAAYEDSINQQSKEKATHSFRSHSSKSKPSDAHSRYVQQKKAGFVDQLTPFAFDPNQIDSVTIVALGLPAWMAHNIISYRQAGKLFKKEDDFSHVYGLTPQQYQVLLPYIQIDHLWVEKQITHRKHQQSHHAERAAHHNEASASVEDTTSIYHPSTKRYPKIPKYTVGHMVELNTADTTELKHIPKVGSGISKMIYYYRLKLGGYASVSQLHEIHLDTIYLKQWLKVDTRYIQRLEVNQTSLSHLYHHPYCSFRQAKYIIDFRKRHGFIKGIATLAQSDLFTKADIMRLKPYLSFEPYSRTPSNKKD